MGEEKILPNQIRSIEQATFTNSPLGKAFQKQIKNNRKSGKKTSWRKKPVEHQDKPELIKGIFRKDLEISEMKNKINEIKKLGEQMNRNDLIY